MSDKICVYSDRLSTPAGVFCHGVKVPAGRSLFFLSGLTARDHTGAVVAPEDTAAQTRQILENMSTLLAEVGAAMDDVVKVVVYVTDMSDITAVHAVRAEYFPRDPPASTMIQVSGFVSTAMRIEIDAVAIVPE